MKILYLEDDVALSATIEEFLTDQGYDVVTAFSGNDVLEYSYDEVFDLFIFDVQVPKIDGFELLKSLREAGITTPTIFTTSRSSIDDLTTGYDVGADDYLKKPFELQELLLRVKALIKREYKNTQDRIAIDDTISYDINLQQLKIDDNIVALNHKESELLKLLLKHRSQCVEFETIFETVWGYGESHNEQSLRTYIKNLRKYIGKDKIKSIKKQGYMIE